MKPKIISMAQLKSNLLKVINHTQKLGQEFVVTKNGHPAAVIMGFDEWEILSDKKTMTRIRENLAYFNQGGKGKSL